MVAVAALSLTTVVAVPSQAEPDGTSAVASAAKPRKPAGKVTLKLVGPKGVQAQASLRGRGGRTVHKNAPRKRARATVKVAPGKFRVVAPELVKDGIVYQPKISRKAFTIKKVKAKKGKRATLQKVVVTVRWKPLRRQADIGITGATTDSVTLKWGGPGKKFELRRATGEKAPATRKAGKRVHLGRKKTLVDRKLAEGGRYSYSVWVKRKKRWVGPVSVTVGTVKGDLGAEYALAPGATIVDAGDKETVTVTDAGVMVKLAAGRPTPPVGSGFVLPASPQLPAGVLGKVAEVSPDGRSVLVVSGTLADSFDHFVLKADYTTGEVAIPDLALGDEVAGEPGVEFEPLPDSGIGDGDSGDGAETTPLGDVLKQQEAASRAKPPVTEAPEASGSSRPLAPARTLPGGRRDLNWRDITVDDAKKLRECTYDTEVELKMHDWTATADGNFDVEFKRKTINTWWGKKKMPAHAMVAESRFQLDVDAKVDATIGKQLSCYLGRELPINIPTYPAPVTVLLSGGLAVEAGGQVGVKDIGVGATLVGTGYAGVGVGVRNDVDGDFSVTPRFSGGTGMAKASGVFGPVASITVGFGGVAGSGEDTSAGTVAGFFGELWLPKIAFEGEWGGEGQENCTTLGGAIEGGFGLVAEAWLGPLKVGGRVTLAEGEIVELFEKNWPADCASDEELGDGDIRATLRWGSNPDYDLHVTDPSGERIYFGHKQSESGGQLDFDRIPGCSNDQSTQSWVENVNWAEGTAPVGTYVVQVVEYNGCGLVDQPWTLKVYVGGQEVISKTGSGTSEAWEFTVP